VSHPNTSRKWLCSTSRCAHSSVRPFCRILPRPAPQLSLRSAVALPFKNSGGRFSIRISRPPIIARTRPVARQAQLSSDAATALEPPRHWREHENAARRPYLPAAFACGLKPRCHAEEYCKCAGYRAAHLRRCATCTATAGGSVDAGSPPRLLPAEQIRCGAAAARTVARR
jgi:hypothetical protein